MREYSVIIGITFIRLFKMNIDLRNPNIIMKLSRLGSFHQSRLSFLRSFLSEFKDWEFKRDLFDLDKNGFVCSGDATLGTFDLTLRNAPDNPLLYRGLCIAKSAQDTPLTEEPAVYGFVRFVDDRPQITTTENVLGLHENEDLMGNKTIMYDGTDSKYKPIQAYTRTALRRVIGRTFH